MKRFHTLFATMALLMLSLAACKPTPVEPPTPPTPPTPVGPELVLTISDVTKSKAHFTVEPLDKELPYLVMVIDKQTFDSFPSEDDYIDDDLDYLRQMAESAEMTLEELLADYLTVGDVSATVEGLRPKTDYILYAYHLTYAGEVISDFYQEPFVTDGYEFNDDSFEIVPHDLTYTSAVVTVTPSSSTTPYFVNVLSEEELEYYGGPEKAYITHLEQLRDYYLSFGKTTEEMIANLCFVGTRSLAVDKLIAGTNYYAYAMSVDEEFFACSQVEVVEFATPSPDTSAITFEVEVEEVCYDRLVGTVVPSNDDPYVCSIQMAQSLGWYGSEEEYMNALVAELNQWYGGVESALHTGPTDLASLAGLYPDSDYVVVCFGYDGAPNTELFTYEFTTAPAIGNPDALVVDFEVTALNHNSMTILCKPSEGVFYFASIITREQLESYTMSEGSVEAAVRMYANEEIDYGAQWFSCTRAEYLTEMGALVGQTSVPFDQLTPSTDYVVYAVAVDLTTGNLASENVSLSTTIRTSEKVVSDASVEFFFGPYYDGTALAELDPTQFTNCRGQVLIPYKVRPRGSAAKWYTSFNYGDYTEWGCTDDDIYNELITYGVEWGSEYVAVNATSGVAVLTYDSPYTFLGLAEDASGNFGRGTLQVITLTREGVSPAEEFLASLAAHQPAKAPAKSAAKTHFREPFRRGENAPEGWMQRPEKSSVKALGEAPTSLPTTNLDAGRRFMAVR